MKTSKLLLLVLLFASGVVNRAHAVILIPDTAVPLPGTTSLAEPGLAGTIIEDNSVPFSMSGGTITGFIQERVIRETVAGTLDFYWRVSVDRTSSGSLGSFRLGDFFTSTYDANWRSDGSGTVNPDYAYLFSGPGGFLNFGFTSSLGPNQDSFFMFLHTDAVDYDKSAFMDLAEPGFDVISDSFPTFAPAGSPVPDAGSTLTLLGLAMGGLAAFRRKIAQR